MTKTVSRTDVWWMFWNEVWGSPDAPEDLSFDPTPHEAPFPVKCLVVMTDSRSELGVVEFEPGEQGRLLRCTCLETELIFDDFPMFLRQLRDVVIERAELAEGWEHLESEPELWGNLDH